MLTKLKDWIIGIGLIITMIGIVQYFKKIEIPTDNQENEDIINGDK